MKIMFACNNPDNGHFQGWFDAVHFNGVDLDGPRVLIRPLLSAKVRIGKRDFDRRGWAEWVGNWCWDEIDIIDPMKLFAYLRKRGFTCYAGPTELFDAWNSGKPLAVEMFTPKEGDPCDHPT